MAVGADVVPARGALVGDPPVGAVTDETEVVPGASEVSGADDVPGANEAPDGLLRELDLPPEHAPMMTAINNSAGRWLRGVPIGPTLDSRPSKRAERGDRGNPSAGSALCRESDLLPASVSRGGPGHDQRCVITFSTQARRSRLAVRHHLAPAARSDDVVAIAGDLVGLHATDPATVFLAAGMRGHTVRPADVERALYDDRAVVRMLGMRRTLFVVPADLVPVIAYGCTRAIARRERTKLVQHIETGGVAADGAPWLRAIEAATLAALAGRGEATASELAVDVPELRTPVLVGEGKKWEAMQNVTTRVLSLLAADGNILRGRPRGSWTSTQYRWAPTELWLGRAVEVMTTADAQVELARRWLRSYGPASVDDLQWWTGWTKTEVRAALSRIAPVDVDLDGVAGVVLADDLEPETPPEPWAALLPALDPTVMGWSQRGWYLGELGPALFDRSGNAGPTVWWDGRIVGGWGQRPDASVGYRVFDDIGGEGHVAVAAAAERLETWLDGVRITPRFRTPLERELAAETA